MRYAVNADDTPGDGTVIADVSACDAVYKIRLEASGIISGPNGAMTSVVR
jgi:hypothetical protein